MTAKQERILKFLEDFYRKNRRYPTLKEIAYHLNLSAVSTVHEHLERLVRSGFLKKEKRGVYKPVKSIWTFPFMGYIAAGYPIEIEDTTFEYIDISDILNCDNCYALKVKGNSMIDEFIINGDIIIVENRQDVLDGEIAVVVIDNEETTLKKFYRENGLIKLVPANPDYEPMYFEPYRVKVQGILRGIIRDYKLLLKKGF
jgi:repressor LexA